MKKPYFLLFLMLGLLAFAVAAFKPVKPDPVQAATKPNIIFILADDLGYGDLGTYGQKYIQTPNLDRMAKEGMRFTRFYTGSAVCAPSRSVLMQGLHSGHTYIRGNKDFGAEGQVPLPGSVVTLPEALQAAGYVTGAFGKWGMGPIGSEGDPLKQGFNTFYGYNCQKLAHRYYPAHLWDNDKKVVLEGNNLEKTTAYAPDIIQAKALQFIEDNKNKPFFLFIPSNLPHAELIAPNDEIYQKYKGKFAETPYKGNDYGTDKTTGGGYTSQANPKATYAAMVSRLDLYAGQVMEKLKKLGLEKNTIVVFASDNGPSKEGGAAPEFFNSNGNLKGFKRDVYEGGIRSPLLVWAPGKIKAGTSAHVAAMWDIYATFAQLAGAKQPSQTDGISFVPTLLNQKSQRQHDYLYWEFHEQGGKQAILKGNFKGVRLDVKKDPNGPLELYNLAIDPAETKNIAAVHPEIIKEMAGLIAKSHVESEVFPLTATRK